MRLRHLLNRKRSVGLAIVMDLLLMADLIGGK